MIALIRRFQHWLDRFTKPPQDELVSCLIRNIASLELAKGETMEFAPIKGCCSPFRVSGTCLPIFEYLVFEKSIMEFILVKVEVAKPDRISITCTIKSETAPDLHGQITPAKDKYKEPFVLLSRHLFRYFPYYKKIVAE